MNEPRILDLEPKAGAGIEIYARWNAVAGTIQDAFDRVHAPGALGPGHGRNFVLYRNETKEGATLNVGVLDREAGGRDDAVAPIHIPGGRVLALTHWGDYSRMREAYARLHAEVKARALKRIWTSLEIYGDWNSDVSRTRTDIYLYLALAI